MTARSITSRAARATQRGAVEGFISALPRGGAVIIVPDHRLRRMLSARITAERPTEAARFWFIVSSDEHAEACEAHARTQSGLPVLHAPGHGLTRARRRALAAGLRASA